jgi:uncharacterized protein with LGFP repeats
MDSDSTPDIRLKEQELRHRLFDLGNQVGPEQDAGFGGRYQEYEKGRIYWHPNAGAHVLYGWVLGMYLFEGGPGYDPDGSDVRRYGFPTSDPGTTEAEWRGQVYELRYCDFEFGTIREVLEG